MPRDYKKSLTSRVPAQWCPDCFHKLDGVTSVGAEATPSPGDFTVCIECGNILRFADDMSLVLSNLMEIPMHSRLEFAKIVSTVKTLGPGQGQKYVRKPM